jgi:redox-sensitive bicupin YhaK (pirin superfamily)
MSILPAHEPGTIADPTASATTSPSAAPDAGAALAVDLEVAARDRDLGGGLVVRRLLPTAARRMVGPFIFLDHMGPVGLAPGAGMDVRPHPHINLATVTYLFEGEIVHRDSLGSEQAIRPGAINWMTAGRGIVHSERSPAAERKAGARLHGLQLWVALPRALEEVAPSFQHHPAASIPEIELPGGVHLRILAGEAYGATSPVAVSSPLHYVEAKLERGARLALPDGVEGRAAYVVEGLVASEGRSFGVGRLIVFRAGATATIEATDGARVILIGGAPVDGERHIWWNFVSSSPERLARAKADWRERRFGSIPGDDQEWIPLPER